ncbi:hypothetical protein ACI2KR_09200 [Pseudomonas luteola]
MFNLSDVDKAKWSDEASKHIVHAGSWSLEYIQNQNRVTRIFDRLHSLSSLSNGNLQIILLSYSSIEKGSLSLVSVLPYEGEQIAVTLSVADQAYKIFLHAPGITQADVLSIKTLQLAELSITSAPDLYEAFARWVNKHLPPESIRDSQEFFSHISEIMDLPYASYVACLFDNQVQIENLFKSKPHSHDLVSESLIRSISL